MCYTLPMTQYDEHTPSSWEPAPDEEPVYKAKRNFTSRNDHKITPMGRIIREALDNARMPQEELADRAALSARYIGAIERADVSASVTVLGQIAEALAVEPGELLKASPRSG